MSYFMRACVACVTTMLIVTLSAVPATAQSDTLLQADAVWLPEIEDLYQSDTETPEWLVASGTEASKGTGAGEQLVVVRGLAGEGSQGALEVAIDRYLLPALQFDQQAETPWARNVAGREVRYHLQNADFIANRFEQAFYKSLEGERYDAFVREAILLDMNPQKIASLQRSVADAIHSHTRIRRVTIAVSCCVLITLLAACAIGYTILDRLTRGYYVSWLRLMTGVALLLSIGVTLHFTRTILSAL